jgi:dTMP kinase
LAAAAGKLSPRGAFITFEGVDGCGKTTQAGLLAGKLREAGYSVVETREPGGTAVGQGLRDVVLKPAHGEVTPACELLLFLADRVQHLAEVIVPALARGDTVICDRYHDSTVAYQKYGRKLDFKPVEGIIAEHIATTPPALTFWLEVELETAQGRINKRQLNDLVRLGDRLAHGHVTESPPADTRLEDEALNFHLRVQAGYDALLQEHPQRIVQLDGSRPVAELAESVWTTVKERLDVL